ncbi:hypothetical protein [Ascidiimonas sp. W6]|uniref:hypothetical protein n=1 Tax=Ascidiimonas meishanensis TaxID=3128903 RepID=UPI0030EC6ABA
MKTTKKVFDLNKKTIANLNKDAKSIKGGVRSIIQIPTTDLTAETGCFDCPPDTFNKF